MGSINIDLPEELHKQIKIFCAMHGISIKDFLIEVLEEEAKESEKKRN